MEIDLSPAAEKKQPKLRWFQYSLRSLFLLTLVVAIGMSWLAVTMRNQRQQTRVARAIERAGGSVASERTWLGKLLGDDSLANVTHVYNCGKPISDADLANFQGLSQLQWLNLAGSNVTDAGLVYLQGLSQLKYLGLSGTKVTDAGLVRLQGLRVSSRYTLTVRTSPTPDSCISKG